MGIITGDDTGLLEVTANTNHRVSETHEETHIYAHVRVHSTGTFVTSPLLYIRKGMSVLLNPNLRLISSQCIKFNL